MSMQRRLARLSAELEALEPAYRDELGAQPNEAETAFARLARRRGKRPLRNGWPDFLVIDEASGGTIGVEVKRATDEVSAAQARMFEALERSGITVMVWDPDRPLALQPWRRYFERETEPSTGPEPRQPRLRRMRTAGRRA
jgi:hypothetical protein